MSAPEIVELCGLVLLTAMAGIGYVRVLEWWAHRGRIIVDMETGERL